MHKGKLIWGVLFCFKPKGPIMFKSDNTVFFKKCKQVVWELFMNRSIYIY